MLSRCRWCRALSSIRYFAESMKRKARAVPLSSSLGLPKRLMIWFVTPSEKDWADSKISQPFQALGGAVVQNAGAYGVEMAERIAWVRVYDPDIDDFRTLTPTECDFGYRTSIFKSKAGSRLIITEAAFVLPQVWQPVTAYKDLSSLFADRDPASVTPAEVETAVRNLRAQKLPDPSQTGSAGSFFKNPVVTKLKARELITLHPNLVSYPLAGGRAKLAAGWLIEAAGLKGLSSGDAAVWPAHALILINRGRATGEDVLKLGREIAERVARRFGVVLEPEPIFLGKDFR